MPIVTDYRRVNLTRVIEQRGGTNNVARILGYSNGSFLSQMTGPNPERRVSETTARRYEQILELPVGALDIEVDVPESPELVKRTTARQMSPKDVADVIMMVGKICEDQNVQLPNAKFASLIVLALEDRSCDHIFKLVQLLK